MVEFGFLSDSMDWLICEITENLTNLFQCQTLSFLILNLNIIFLYIVFIVVFSDIVFIEPHNF